MIIASVFAAFFSLATDIFSRRFNNDVVVSWLWVDTDDSMTAVVVLVLLLWLLLLLLLLVVMLVGFSISDVDAPLDGSE